MMTHSNQKNHESQDFSGIFPVWKKHGETLAVLLDRFREERAVPAWVKITYAGRLDPAAEGVVLLCVGKAVYQKENLLKLDKIYLLTVFFGIQTDTADLLGLPLMVKNGKPEDLSAAIGEFVGERILPYPAYSSKPVAGKPLFAYARAGQQVEVPSKQVFIKSIKLLEQKEVAVAEILDRVHNLAKTVQGDFRQQAIQAAWEMVLKNKKECFSAVTIQVTASSGTYMRSLAEAIGGRVGLPACAFAIVREKVGAYTAQKLP